MILYPAIDIQNGECVRLRRGDFADVTVFSNDPVARARQWQEEEAEALHVVDLDGARLGKPVNFHIIEELADGISIPVQCGGGVRTIETVKLFEESSLERIIIGTGAITDQSFLAEAVKILGGRLVVSVDADRGMVTTHGWQQKTRVSAVSFAHSLQEAGVKNVLYTDIARDGMMAGMNLESLGRLAEEVDINVIASGGISSLEDLRSLKQLSLPNIKSVIVGRALYEGAFTVAEARAILD